MVYSTNPDGRSIEDDSYYDIKFFTNIGEDYWASDLKVARIYDSYVRAIDGLAGIRLIERLEACKYGVDMHPGDRYED